MTRDIQIPVAGESDVPIRDTPVKERLRKIDLPEVDALPVFRYY